MWIPDDDPGYQDDCSKEQGNEKIKFRSSSPPFEGGESLCEFYIESSEHSEKLKALQNSGVFPENCRDGFPIFNPSMQNDVFRCFGEEKFPSKNFISLLNQDLLPTSTFTQTFLQSILSSVDSSDPVVANAWMETLLDVIDLLPKEVVKGEILTLAVNKGQLSQPISSRLLCCKMLGKICMKFDPYIIMKEVLPVVLSLCQDVDFEVRGFMCRQLDIVAKGIGLEATKSAILPELVELANDEETFVRLAGIETVVQMVPILDDDTCTQAIIPLVKKFCENSLSSKDSTLPVVSKQLGRLCHGLTDNFTVEQKQWFLGFFQDLAKLGLSHQEKNSSVHYNPMPDLLPEVDHKDRYRECRCACAYNFPAMVLFSGPENFEKELYFTFKELCADPFANVRRTMACGFYEIARLLGSKAYILHPELVLLLQDDSVEVLKGLVPCLPESLKAVCCLLESPINNGDDREDSLVKALIACEEATSVTSSWRLHADLLSCLSCLPSCISSETIFTTFVPLLFVKLHISRPIPCRIAAAYSLLVFLRNTPSLERRKGIINELIRELCYGKSCHKRMLFIRVCELVIELFSKVFFKLHFFKPLLSLSVDPVPNIRLRLCTILPRLKGLIKLPKDSLLLQQLESCVKTLMTDEKDKDVSFAVSKAIEELDKIEVATEPISRRSSCIEVALDIKDRVKENEERKQLEMEFNSKFVKENKILIPPVVAGSTNKTGKIPVRKSGTLPKQSNAASNQMNSNKDATPSPYKSLKNIKKERRISSPGLNVDFQKNQTKNLQFTKDCPVSSQSMKNFTSSKCNIPDSRSLSPTIGTWPRQKRLSCIPKQSDRCPSPMLQTRRFSVKKTTKIAVPKSSNCSPSSPVKNVSNETSVSGKDKTETQCLLPKDISSKITLESNRKINITPFPSPVIRRSSTFTNLNAESKIPTSCTKRRSTISEN
ncbi:serine/threonine-protein phosphatase 4 regulatory subunit 4-like isoform X2 [Stegodyphus dumicola]|uniref:serine/threonine-protein phosphatase 4 regulatory subunit 4-like isoform X2 n=1 Tax=Stegodyphus dumicola TaxID=202533 RepID=UPI0015AD7F15|nr:serine/threonine-protein phosphatase 4 regulatory subunit 4-like isoform X2 [Stegodyphus dumicola]